MATATAAKTSKTAARSAPSTNELKTFLWQGTDKRGKKMKGEMLGKNENLIKSELRKQGINPTSVGTRSTGLFARRAKISAQ